MSLKAMNWLFFFRILSHFQGFFDHRPFTIKSRLTYIGENVFDYLLCSRLTKSALSTIQFGFVSMVKLKLTGQNLGRVFNFRNGHVVHFLCYGVKLPNLKLKTQPKQLLGSLPLDISLPACVALSDARRTDGVIAT